MQTRLRAISLVAALMVSACAAPRPETPPPAARRLAVGEEFDIRLPSNPSTGYQWQVAALDEKVVRLVDTRWEPQVGGEEVADGSPPARAVGVGGTSVLTFVGVADGRGVIRLVYVRPWEKGIAPARRADYAVEVLADQPL